MKEKISLATKLKERVLIKNFPLMSLNKLPSEIYKNLSVFVKNFLILYQGNLLKPQLEVISDTSLFIHKEPNLPDFKDGEILLLVLPFSQTRYVFQVKVVESQETGWKVEIVDPRTDERIPIKKKIPIFFSYINPQYVQSLIQDPEYQLLRESNFSVDTLPDLEEVHLYDLILNANHNIDENFKKLIQKTFLVGELVNISRGGLSAKTPGQLNISDDFGVFYVKFNLPLSNRIFKFALFSHLRNIVNREGFTVFHLSYITSLREEFWRVLKDLFTNL
jgi:hypothetical protein